jgi:Tn7-like transposition protein D
VAVPKSCGRAFPRTSFIPEYTLSSRLRDGRPTANFNCGCGFSYARSGPDSSPKDTFRIGRMISFGPLWEAKLKLFWEDSSLSLSEVGRRLGVDTLTVRRHAARLNLPDSRPARKSKPLKRAARLKGTNDLTAHVEKRRAYRVTWVSAMRQAPRTTLKALRRKLPREYAWLIQKDAAWLKRHSPTSRRGARSISSVDWRKRDADYAVAVRATAANLMNKSGRPIQVTKTSIGKALGAVTLLQQKLSKMHLTAQVLVSVVETREQYAIRRVWWAADLFIEEGVLPRHWQLI